MKFHWFLWCWAQSRSFSICWVRSSYVMVSHQQYTQNYLTSLKCVVPHQLRQKLTVQSEWQMGSGSEWVNFNTVDGQVGNLEVGRMKTGCVCNSECVFVLLLYLYNYMVIGVWGVSCVTLGTIKIELLCGEAWRTVPMVWLRRDGTMLEIKLSVKRKKKKKSQSKDLTYQGTVVNISPYHPFTTQHIWTTMFLYIRLLVMRKFWGFICYKATVNI